MLLRILISLIILFFSAVSDANQWHDEADRCWNEALKFKKERNYKQAIEYCKRAVVAERKNADPRATELIAELNEIGQLYNILGDYDTSLHYYSLTLKTSEKYNNAEQVVIALNNIGQTYGNLKRIEESLKFYQQALEISKKQGSKDMMVLVLNNIAATYRVMKDFSKALDKYNEALSAAKESGSAFNIAAITSNIGTLYFFKGDYDTALENYSKALDIDRAQKNDEYISIDLSNISGVYAAKGRYGEALNYIEKSLEIDKKQRNEKNIASRLNRIGYIYYRLNDNNLAIEHYNGSLEINMKLNNTVNSAYLQSNLGLVYDSMGQYEKALDHYIKALALNKDMEQQENIMLRLSDIGMLYETRDRHGEAVEYLGKALLFDMMSEKRNRIAYNLSNIGRVMISLKRYDKALEYFKQSVGIYRELGDSLAIGDDLKNCGIVYYYLKDYIKAIEYLRQSIQTLETIKDKGDLTLQDIGGDVYRWLTATYIKASMPDKAYENIETFCINKIYALSSDVKPAKQIQSLSFEKLQKNLGKNGAAIIFSNTLWDNPFLIFVDSNSTSGYEIDKAWFVNTVYNKLGKDIEKFMGEKKTDIIFKIQQKSRHDYYYIEFEKIVNYYRSLLSKKYITGVEYETLKFLSKTFYQFLFQKIDEKISGKEELIIQPDGALSTVPFETLIMPDGRFMVEKFGMKYMYSYSAVEKASGRIDRIGRKAILAVGGMKPLPHATRKKIESVRHFDLIVEGIIGKIRSNKGLLEMYGFFGYEDFGDIPASVTEINAIKEVKKDADSVSGDMASEIELKRMSQEGLLANYRILHFASRNIVIPEVPQLSALIVSYRKNENKDDEGLMNAKEIASLKISADLVHIGDIYMPPAGYTRGEGIWNICSSFVDAGARGVSLSLWPMDEAAKIYFLKQVYQLALNKGMSFDRAFTQTKRAFIQGKMVPDAPDLGSSGSDSEGNYSNPYFWGSFIYYGY
jgi:tetratricopeptide (TPR) repeat protein